VRLLVVGAGGHAKVVVDAAAESGWELAGVIGQPGDPVEVLGVEVYSEPPNDIDGFIIAVGDNRIRARMFDQYVALGFQPVNVVHPRAVVAPNAVLGAGTFIAAGAVINPDARIGANVILNTGCTVDHDCNVAAHAHVGPGANLCGNVHVGEGALLGVGCCAIGGTHIGQWSVIGAGAAVVDDLPESSVCVGVPARAIRATERSA